MARHSAGVTTGAGSTTLPIISLYATAAQSCKVREIGVSNTTAVAVLLHLVRLTTAGTQGAALTNANYDPASVAICTAFTTHTVAPTLGNDLGHRCALGAAVGAAFIWPFGDTGLIIPVGTANGIGVIVTTGTGQACAAYIVWDE